MPTVADRIRHLHPCQEAIEWASGYTDPAKAWAECPRGDYLLWLLGKLAGPPESDGRRKLVLCACQCARLALPHTSNKYVLTCLETAERWAVGTATLSELQTARNAIARNAIATYATTCATTCATYATYATYTATYAAYAAQAEANIVAYAATYAAAGAAAGAGPYAKESTLAQCADIVRQHYPHAPTISPQKSTA